MSAVTFDPVRHVYRVDGRKIPNVTGVLHACGVVDDYWFTEIARQRGSAVHKATELIDRGCLDESSVDPRLLGYLEAYQNFKDNCRPDWTHIEQRVFDPIHRYAGTLDRAGHLGATDRLWVIDLKTGAPQRWVRLQLVAYANALRVDTGKFYHRASLQLKESGRFILTPYGADLYQTDLMAFTGAMALLRWMKREEDMTCRPN